MVYQKAETHLNVKCSRLDHGLYRVFPFRKFVMAVVGFVSQLLIWTGDHNILLARLCHKGAFSTTAAV